MPATISAETAEQRIILKHRPTAPGRRMRHNGSGALPKVIHKFRHLLEQIYRPQGLSSEA